MDFYFVFVRTEINLIAFSGPRNCVNTQYAALSGAMIIIFKVKRSTGPNIFLCFNIRPYFTSLFTDIHVEQNRTYLY